MAGVLTTLALLLPGPAAASAQPGATVNLSPERVGWSAFEMRATKLFLSADARVELALRPAAEVKLRSPPGITPVPAGPEILVMAVEAAGAGRRSRTELYMDPFTGAALQRDQHDYQGRLRERVYRFAPVGAYQWTRWPATGPEKSLPPAQWTRTSEGLRAYPSPATASATATAIGVHPGPVLEPTGLLYAVAAAPLDRPGDQAMFSIFSRRALQRVTVTVVQGPEIDVRYDQQWPAGTVRRDGRLRPIHLTLEGEPMGGDPDDEELELLGLRGKLALALEPETRAPLELSGNIKILGRVTLRLGTLQPR